MKIVRAVFSLLFFILILQISAQISIDWTEIPQDVGIEWIRNSIDSVTVNLGSTGGPQTWNFTSQPMGSESCYVSIVDESLTPFIDSFPTANLAYREPADSDTVYQYYNLESEFLIYLGLAGESPTTPFFWEYNPVDSFPLPQSYGNTHNYHYGFLDEVDTINSFRYDHFGSMTCDAYGTVNIPYDSYDCLRICTYDTCVMVVYYSGIPVFTDTSTFINYQFTAEDYGAVVCVKSYPGETNPNYTDAYILERLTYFSSGVDESEESNNVSILHYPDPFSDYVNIEYYLPTESNVDLRIYDIYGGLVKKVVSNRNYKGEFNVRWYGRDDSGNSVPNGIYFYHLKTDNKNITGKMLLIR